jgi:hypothetical protein
MANPVSRTRTCERLWNRAAREGSGVSMAEDDSRTPKRVDGIVEVGAPHEEGRSEGARGISVD